MAEPGEKLRKWAERQKLPSAIVDVLEEEDFDMESLRQLTVDDFKDFENIIQKPKLLKGAQCLKLRKALETLCEAPVYAYGSEQTSARAKVTLPSVVSPKVRDTTARQSAGQRSMEPTPSGPAEEEIPAKPKAGHVKSTRSVFEGFTHGVKNLFASKPQKVEEFRFLLLGKTGSGKSTTGNTIFGEKLFASGLNFSSCTSKCDLKRSKKDGQLIEIMDSPGLYDTSKTQEEICTIIVQAVACMHPGPHAILYVLTLSRYTEEEFGVYKRLKALFDENITRYIILLFTGGDQLDSEGKKLSDLLLDAPKNLVQVVQECGNRALVFNNMTKNTQPQVKRLFQEVRNMKAEYHYLPYTCPKYNVIGESLEEEVARRLEAVTQRDLEREHYIRELEVKAKQAKDEAEKQKIEFDKRERQREAQIEEERVKHRQKLKEMEKEYSSGKMTTLEEQKVEEVNSVIIKLQAEAARERKLLEEKLEQKRRLEDERREEEMEELDRKQQAYEAELNRMKDAISTQEEPSFVKRVASGIVNVVSAPFRMFKSLFS